MPDTHLLEEGGRRHFMVRRFDRTTDGRKLHMQSLGALSRLVIDQVREAVSRRDVFAERAGVSGAHARGIATTHRLDIPAR